RRKRRQRGKWISCRPTVYCIFARASSPREVDWKCCGRKEEGGRRLSAAFAGSALSLLLRGLCGRLLMHRRGRRAFEDGAASCVLADEDEERNGGDHEDDGRPGS